MSRSSVDKLLKRGVKHVVIKRGPRGASYFSANETHHVAGFSVPVVDPTGAGDCFGATFVSLFLNGATPRGGAEMGKRQRLAGD